MRYVLVAALLAAWPSFAQLPFMAGEELQEAVKAKCAEGCMVLNESDMEALTEAVKHFAAQAYQEGKREGSSLCRL
jgi:hypothetical protein